MFFDFDLLAIDVGFGGVCAARSAAGFGARVAVVENRYLSGTCVNVGCVPKKLLVYGTHFSEDFEQAWAYSWSAGEAQFDRATLIGNKNREIQRLNGIHRNPLVNSGMTLLEDHARLLDAHNIEVDGQCFSARHILVATGSWSQVPDTPDKKHAITFNEAFLLKRLPRHVLVVGGGYIAVEFTPIFNGLGAGTTLLYCRDLSLRGPDRSVREHLRDESGKKGLGLQSNSDIACIDKQTDGSLAATLKDGRVLEMGCMFYATGRWPMLDGLDLENTGVKLTDKGLIAVDKHYQTSEPSALALGDVVGCVQLTPVALAEGMTVVWRLSKPEEYRPVNYKLIPTAVFSLPNIGTVDLTEEEALSARYEVKIFESRFRPMKLTLTDDQEKISMKLVVDVHDDRVLGYYMVGAEAGGILQGIAVTMKAGATKQAFNETIGIHPTAVEEFITLRMPTH